MRDTRFQKFVDEFLLRRALPVPETVGRLRQSEGYAVAARQCRAGASERVLGMLLERALRE